MAEAPDPSDERPQRPPRPRPVPHRRRRRTHVAWWAVPLVVLAVLLAAEGFARVVGPNIPRESGSEERAYVKADQIYARGGSDVVVLGSSESAAGLVPADVMREVPALDGGYNAALVGAPLSLTDEWARRVVLPELDPKVVVIGLFPTGVIDLSGYRKDPKDRTISAYRGAFDQIDPGGLGSLGWKLRQRSALIRYRPYLRDPVLTWKGVKATLQGGAEEPSPEGLTMDARTETDPKVVAALTAPDGEILEYRQPSPTGTDNAAAVAAFSHAAKAPVDLAPLERLVRDVRRSGATPVIAMAPIDRGVLEAQGADLSGLDGIAAKVERWADDNDVPLFSEFGETWSADSFNDRQHVSAKGAERWSRDLGRWLADQCAGPLAEACR